MKKIFILLGLIATIAIHAQDWSPILVNQKMNYQHSDSAYITNTIWVDSAQIADADSLFYLNRIVKDVPGNPEIVLRNQAQFFSKSITKQDAGNYYFASPFNYFIPTLAELGDEWNFTNTISAEITDVFEDDIFGIQDSIKTISLSDGNEIRLSKNFGIIKFPDFENGGYLELVGLQDTDFGEQVIGFWDIFDYEVGDVHQINYDESFPSYYDHHISKYLINSKEVFDDHITYTVNSIKAGYYSWYGSEPTYYSNTYSGELTYSVADYEITNKFQNELVQLTGYYCSPDYNDDYIFARISIYPDSMGLINKHWGSFFNSPIFPYVGLYYETNPSNDSLILVSGECLSNGPHGMNYCESLGNTLNYYEDFIESEDYFYLMGYVMDGDTIGEVYPDSYFITGIEPHSKPFNNYLIYPNPATDWIYIKPKESSNGDSYNIELHNIFGQLIWKESNLRSSHYAIHIADLKSGVYFYEIGESQGNIQQGKFIVK